MSPEMLMVIIGGGFVVAGILVGSVMTHIAYKCGASVVWRASGERGQLFDRPAPPEDTEESPDGRYTT